MYKLTVPVICSIAYKHREETLAELKRCKAQRVALALETAFADTLMPDESLNRAKELIEYFESNGFETLVWISSLGHDRITLMQEDDGFEHIEYMEHGKVLAYCPMDEKFLKAYSEMVLKIAKIGAKMIMIDDDFRMGLGFGCCCKLHMEAFCKELNEEVSPKELKNRILKGGKNKYRSAWLKVQRDGLRGFAKKLRETVDKINPNIRLGACVTMGRWDADGADAIEIAEILAGNTKPFIRTFGAPYHTTLSLLGNAVEEERFLGNVVEKTRTQLKWCENQDIEIMVEGDTWPRPRFSCSAAYLECHDLILRAAGGADGILKYMIDYTSSPLYETGYIDAMVENKELYTKVEEMFCKKKAVGVRPYLIQRTIEDAEINCETFEDLRRLDGYAFDESSAFELLTSNNIPSSYEENIVNVLFGESARHITEEELNNGAIIDLVAAKILMQRGIDIGIKEIDEENLLTASSKYDAAIEHFIDEDEDVSVSAIEVPKIIHNKEAKILTKYKKGKSEYDFVFEYENKSGQRFLVFPFVAKSAVDKCGIFRSYSRRRQLVKSIEYISKKPLLAYPEGNYPMLYTLVKESEDEVSIGLWNLFTDKIKNARIRVNTDFEDIGFVNCTGHKEGNLVVLDGYLYPYEFAGIKIKRI